MFIAWVHRIIALCVYWFSSIWCVNGSVIFARNNSLKQIVCLYLFALIYFAPILNKQDVIILVISLTFVYLCSIYIHDSIMYCTAYTSLRLLFSSSWFLNSWLSDLTFTIWPCAEERPFRVVNHCNIYICTEEDSNLESDRLLQNTSTFHQNNK